MGRAPAVRNRRKVSACSVTNAQAFLRVQDEFGSFDKYVLRFVEESRDQFMESALQNNRE
jgi:DNA-3-methyladenine glycosylase I